MSLNLKSIICLLLISFTICTTNFQGITYNSYDEANDKHILSVYEYSSAADLEAATLTGLISEKRNADSGVTTIFNSFENRFTQLRLSRILPNRTDLGKAKFAVFYATSFGSSPTSATFEYKIFDCQDNAQAYYDSITLSLNQAKSVWSNTAIIQATQTPTNYSNVFYWNPWTV